MRKEIFAVFLICVCLGSFVGSVVAWTTDSATGDWTDSELNTVVAGDGSGVLSSVPIQLNNLTDGQGYEFILHVNDISGRKDWWALNGVKKMYFAIGFKSANLQNVYALMYLAHEQGMFYNTSQCKVGSVQAELGDTEFWDFPNSPVNNADYYVQLKRVSATLAQVQYKALINNDVMWMDNVNFDLTYFENITVAPEFWDDLDATLYVGHEGYGSVDAYFGELSYHDVITDYTDTVGDDIWAWITDIWNFAANVFTMLGTVAKTIVPLLPWLALAYFMDAFVTSIATSSFTPIGYAFRTLWEMIKGAAEMVIGVVQAIAEAIPF